MHFWEFVALVSFDKGSEGSAVPRKSGLNCTVPSAEYTCGRSKYDRQDASRQSIAATLVSEVTDLSTHLGEVGCVFDTHMLPPLCLTESMPSCAESPMNGRPRVMTTAGPRDGVIYCLFALTALDRTIPFGCATTPG